MDSDLALILGLVLGCLAIPAIVAAYSDRRPPRTSAVLMLVAAGLIAYAALTHPVGYEFRDIPDVFFSVLGRFS